MTPVRSSWRLVFFYFTHYCLRLTTFKTFETQAKPGNPTSIILQLELMLIDLTSRPVKGSRHACQFVCIATETWGLDKKETMKSFQLGNSTRITSIA